MPTTRTVIFVGEFFTLMTTVTLDESLRAFGERDDDFATRLASESFYSYYGWDVSSHSNEIGIVED